MSESQKHKAKRIVDLLIDNCILGETKTEDSSSVVKKWLSIQQPARELFEEMLAKIIAQAEAPKFAIGTKVKINGLKGGMKRGNVTGHSVGYDPILYRIELENDVGYWLEVGFLELDEDEKTN